MSFEEMRLADLRDVCEKFAVEYEPGANKRMLLDKLEAEGVEYEVWDKLYAPQPEAKPEETVPRAVKKKDTNAVTAQSRFTSQVVLKMERKNPRFDVQGKTFTRDHPFIAMTEEEAQNIIDAVPGFRIATPREVEAYYH